MKQQKGTDWIGEACSEIGVTSPFGPEYSSTNAPEGWQVLEPELAEKLATALRGRYPVRKVIPFARREDSDDVACIVVQDPERRTGSVLVVHDYASPGWEVEAEFIDVATWITCSLSQEQPT